MRAGVDEPERVKERPPDSSHSILFFTISHLLSCLDLSEAEGSKAYSNGAFLPDTD